jgi:hypothetical protein
MLEYTIGTTAKNADWGWQETGNAELSPHREKLSQLKAELEGMMAFGEPGSFLMERLKALHAGVSEELGG